VSSAAIEVNGMSVRYGTLTALGDFDFVAPERTVTAVIGPNGSGKTTFLNALTGAVPYQTGRVTILGTPIERATPGVMHRMGLSRTFQNLDLMDDLSVEDNVKLGAACRSASSLIEAALALPRSFRETRERTASARAALAQLDISALGAVKVSELSYGMRRRVEVARALASSPKVLLLDEPTAGMGPNESAEFAALVLHLRDELGLTVVLIEHDMSVVRATAEQVYVLSAGRDIANGPAAAVLDQAEVKRVYLGDFEVASA
jgi:branched-chain amino acid transport system ATP-binding protein